ncbi:polysaccharide biosynthesis/export family protein [Thalassovita taeanensis]|nr:polysaccharide biosynthesis/export family protein [Thalassovita taeanensis]
MPLVALCLSLLLTAGCSLPRGAALSSEILAEKHREHPSFQVVSVSRDNINVLGEWPVTGWKGSYNWINAQRGPQSPLIRTGDLLHLVIWDSQENSLLISTGTKQAKLDSLAVSTKGEVFIPYLGAVQVRNMTPDAAREKIQAALEPIVPSAQVQLSLQAGLRNSVDLVGGVSRPGTYPLPDRNYTIVSLLAQGGGISANLRNPVVRLNRGNSSYEIRAERLMSEPQLNTTLRGDDKIVVEEDQRFFTALGATGREELVYFEREHITAMEALSTIGGLSDGRANLKSVLILRDYPAKALHKNTAGPTQEQVIFTFDLTSADGLFAARKFGINPQDTVFATEAVVTSARTVLGLIGSVVGVSNAVNNISN